MNDDIYNKLKTMLSGSLQLNKEDANLEEQNLQADEEAVNSFMNQILDAAWVEEDLKSTCTPSYYLSKKNKSYWLMNTTLKFLCNVNGGIEITPIETGEKYTICLVGYSTYSIPNNLIVCAGWN